MGAIETSKPNRELPQQQAGLFKSLWQFTGSYRTLHLTWFAFFLTFVAWFNMAPLATTLQAQLGLTTVQLKILAICNVALTIPARILIGMLLDALGPRKVFSTLLVVMSVPCFAFALSSEFTQLVISRLLLGVIGAGFVIGIRMISEWFPPKQVGIAGGIYGGWGNFGSSAAAVILPIIALNIFGGENGWRFAIMLTGLACLIYGFIYYYMARDTPAGKTYHKPKRHGAMEVTSWAGLLGLIVLSFPLFLALGVLTWKLNGVGFITETTTYFIYILLGLLYLIKCAKIIHVNRTALTQGIPQSEKYDFRQVAVLSLAYLVTFGAELSVVSILPTFFETTWSLRPQTAGLIAATYALMNLISRPLGGWFSDYFGSRKQTLIWLLVTIGVGFSGMSLLNLNVPLVIAVIITMTCAFFAQAGSGAVFAMVPLVKKPITGQVAGMVGAYGNIGALSFLTVFSFVETYIFFLTIAGVSLIAMVYCLFIKEPKGSFAEEYSTQPTSAISEELARGKSYA